MKKIELRQMKDSLKDRIDVFICSASFEDRCFAIPNEAVTIDIASKLIFYVTDLESNIIQNAGKLASLLGNASRNVELAINDPGKTLRNINSALSEIFSQEKPQCYLVDITTFTHEGLLILMKLLQLRLKKSDKVIACYNGAKEYSYNESVAEKKWLSKGVKKIRSILGYPGLLDPSKKNHLIVLFGFERERTKRLIDMFEYDLVSLAFGGKGVSISEDHQVLNEKRHEELLILYPNARKFEISLIDAIDTKQQLLAYMSDFSEYNTVIAPMNNKISTVGAGLAAIENPEIQLCYVTANQYNLQGYSHPSPYCYLFEVLF